MRILIAALSALALTVVTAQAQDIVPELAFLDDAAEVELLNEGGKRKLVDSFKDLPALIRKRAFDKVAKGETCRMKKGSLIQKVRDGTTPNTVRVRNLVVQTGKRGCPFWTEFELNKVRYDVSRRIFELKTKELF